MAKRILISIDAGTTWFTFPGNRGEATNEAGVIKDTIFGQDYDSSQSGLIGWGVSCNGLYKGYAGYVAKILQSGIPTALNNEPMVQIGTTTSWQVTNAAKRVWDRTWPVIIKDNAVIVGDADINSLDFLWGRVVFRVGYTVVGPVTVSAKYLPMATIGKANAFTLNQTAASIDNTTFDEAQANNGHRTFQAGLKTMTLDLTGIYDATNAWRALLESRAEVVIEVNPDGSSLAVGRGFFKPLSTGQSGDVGALEAATLNFGLSVPDQENVEFPFLWRFFTPSTLNQAIINALTIWRTGDLARVRYLGDGTNGFQGDAIVTDVTLTGGLEVMNEFAIKFQGSGEATLIP